MANKLQFETSPYLLQHAHNPVDWYPWGEEAFAKAAAEHKPVLVSIGYATCHWCHVMERESFEKDEVAAYMNEHFVCIKVDREEHPDVDHFYMDALQAMQQSGGWPLNMFVTPDRKPFYGGTYFPPQKLYHRPSWMEVLEAVHITWDKKQDDIQHQSNQLLQYLQQTYQYESQEFLPEIDVTEVVRQISLQYDAVNGGFSAAPKFPNFSVIRLLTHIAKNYRDTKAEEMALFTLSKLTTSGIYDPVAGGLCRYATDTEWRIPHFEKMLYDNALLITSLAHVYAIQSDKKWMHIISQITQFCEQTLKQSSGLYASAMDADSEGVEGKYYVWTYDELQSFQSFNEAIATYYDLSTEGNWEDGLNILHQVASDAFIIEEYSLLPKQWTLMKQQFLMELWHKRQSRIAPIVDTKVILSLNALLASAFFTAAKSLGVEQYKDLGTQLLDEIIQQFINIEQDEVYHLAKEAGRSTILAKLDDLAYLIQALIQGYSVVGRKDWYDMALKMVGYCQQYFSDEQEIMFYFSDSRQQDVLVRKIELYDGAILSSNAVMSENLWWLGQLAYDVLNIDRSTKMNNAMAKQSVRYPTAYATWLHNALRSQKEWSVVKKNIALESFEQTIFYQQFLDQKMLISEINSNSNAAKNGLELTEIKEVSFQECTSGLCKPPVNTVFQLF